MTSLGSLPLILGALFFSWDSRSGVAIEIGPDTYQKLLRDIDTAAKQLPREWESYGFKDGALYLPSGTVISVNEVKRLSILTPNQLLDFFEKNGVAVKLICSKRANYLKTIDRKNCVEEKSLPKSLDFTGLNALYVSRYSTAFEGVSTPVMVVRQDSPKYSLLHEWLHHKQEVASPKYYKDYSFKSMRVAVGDYLFERGKERSGVENLAFQELQLIQWLGDEVENYGSMLKYHKLYGLKLADAHELHWKLRFYLDKCQSKKCRSEYQKADAFFAELQNEAMRERFKDEYSVVIEKKVVEEALKKAETYANYQSWFDALRNQIYDINQLQEERAQGRRLWKAVNDPSFPYKDKHAAFETLFTWMAKNAMIQYHALKLATEIQKETPSLRVFQPQIAADLESFSKYIQ